MNNRPQIASLQGYLGFLTWVGACLCLVAFFILSPQLFSQPIAGHRLGADLPMRVLVDQTGTLAVENVAAKPEAAFIVREGALNEGYTQSVYWIKASLSSIQTAAHNPLWLQVMPTYLDNVTVYQKTSEGWQARHSGDTVPITQRVHVRPLAFELETSPDLIIRVETTSAMQFYASVWSTPGLMAELSAVEWASGVQQGINLALALLICSTALALRTRALLAMSTLSVVVLIYGTMTKGYMQLWLPAGSAEWTNLAVSIGVFILPAAFTWLGRELFTQGTNWRRLDRLLSLLIIIPIIAITTIWFGAFTKWAWLAVTIPWFTSLICAYVAWSNLQRQGPSAVAVLMALPYTIHTILGGYIAAAFIGLVHSSVEVALLWQLEGLFINILIAVAVGVRLMQQHQESVARQNDLVENLARSEQVLDERVKFRTAELLRTQNTLQATLHREQQVRLEQRQFFTMVSHELRTPLAVIDSAATEQQTFPTLSLEAQVESATQIRRACRRLTALVDNCLVNDRLDADSFKVQSRHIVIVELLEEATELVTWSSKHTLRLSIDKDVSTWIGDRTLLTIAISNLVDNAVKYGKTGEVFVEARLSKGKFLELVVEDSGPGLSTEISQRLFEQFERGKGTDRTRGFGLGLWVTRRIAILHGGEVKVQSVLGKGTRFTLLIPYNHNAHNTSK